MYEQIQLLRSRDKVHLLAQHILLQLQSNTPQIFESSAIEGLHRLLQMADNVESKVQVKFIARTIYLSLIINRQDMFDSHHVINSYAKSSLLEAFQTQENPQIFNQFLEQETIPEINLYLESVDHIEVKSKIEQIIAQVKNISTPYDYAELMGKHLALPNIEKLSTYIIDLCLTIPETCYFSSQDIFIGTCLYINYKFNFPALDLYLKTFFVGSYIKGEQLLNWLKEFFVGFTPSN